MSSVSKDPWKKFPLGEPQELERSNKFEYCPYHFWEVLKDASFFPKSLIEESDTSILCIYISFIFNG